MYSQVLVIVGLVCTSLAYPRNYQEQRQLYYSQQLPNPFSSYQLPQQQVIQYQLPASTSFLPNNVPGLRYGQQQQVVYVVPGGSQVLFEEGTAPSGQGNSPYLESFMNLLNGHLPAIGGNRPAVQAPEKPVEKPNEEKPAENSASAVEPQNASAEEAVAEYTKPQPESISLLPSAQQIQSYPILSQQQQQQPVQPLAPSYSQQDQQLLQQRLFLLNQPQTQQALYNRQYLSAPAANYLLNYRTFPLSDKKPGSSAIAFQKLLQKSAEAAAANSTETGESAESDATISEEIGPSIAQAKPQAVSVAGPGGVAAAAPVATAIVGPGGMALSAPTATAVAGTKPQKPSDKTKSSYLSRANLYPF